MHTGTSKEGFIQFDTGSFDKYNLAGIPLPSTYTSYLGTAYIAVPSAMSLQLNWLSRSPLRVTQQQRPLTPARGATARGRAPAYLEERSHHVEDYENQGERSVSTLHGADGVKKNQVSRHHQKSEHTGRAGIHICKETKTEFRLMTGLNSQQLCSLLGLQGTRQHSHGQMRRRDQCSGRSSPHCRFRLEGGP